MPNLEAFRLDAHSLVMGADGNITFRQRPSKPRADRRKSFAGEEQGKKAPRDVRLTRCFPAEEFPFGGGGGDH